LPVPFRVEADGEAQAGLEAVAADEARWDKCIAGGGSIAHLAPAEGPGVAGEFEDAGGEYRCARGHDGAGLVEDEVEFGRVGSRSELEFARAFEEFGVR